MNEVVTTAPPPVKKKGGMPRRFKTPEILRTAIDEYIGHCKEEELPITIVGFALYSSINEKTLRDGYKNNKEFGEGYSYLMAHCKNDLLNNALQGKYNSAIARLVLSVNHGMKEVVEARVDEQITINFVGKKF